MNGKTLTLLVSAGIATGRLSADVFPPDAWPSRINPDAIVHYMSVDNVIEPPSDNWTQKLTVLSGGDQTTSKVSLSGRSGLKVLGSYLNTADAEFRSWADEPTIDILVQVYGDGAILGGDGQPRNYSFLIGVLPELAAPAGGSIPLAAKNQKWNWYLFRIPNGLRPSDGSRFVGSIPANAQGATQFGGVNGGTIRTEGVPNLIIGAIAFGQKGAFGEPGDYTEFAAPDVCDPEPETNLAWIDFAHDQTDHMQLLTGGDQPTEIVTGGPAGDERRSARALGNYMNVGITDHYLGQACNDPRATKVCIEFYDDPALAGVRFGPEAFAADSKGTPGFYDATRRYTMTGSGAWVSVSWIIPSVNLFGINTVPLTAGPRIVFESATRPLISRFDLAVLRVPPSLLAGQDPLSGCYEDPLICTDAYGKFAEMDLAAGVFDGLAPGTSGGDQVMIQEEAGPESDRRPSIRPALDDGPKGAAHIYMNFAITNKKLGPSTQPNAKFAICATYYDDPDLQGKGFRPEVYLHDSNGTTTFAFTPGSIVERLKGTGRWKEAYFQIDDMKFLGVNQGPQAAARFVFDGKIHFSRLRYAVIPPCGVNAGVNLLQECKQPRLALQRDASGGVKLSWTAQVEGWSLESTPDLLNPDWQPIGDAETLVDDRRTVVTSSATTARYYRLRN